MEKELFTIEEHPSLHLVLSGIPIAQYLVLCVVIVDNCSFFYSISFGNCTCCHSSFDIYKLSFFPI